MQGHIINIPDNRFAIVANKDIARPSSNALATLSNPSTLYMSFDDNRNQEIDQQGNEFSSELVEELLNYESYDDVMSWFNGLTSNDVVMYKRCITEYLNQPTSSRISQRLSNIMRILDIPNVRNDIGSHGAPPTPPAHGTRDALYKIMNAFLTVGGLDKAKLDCFFIFSHPLLARRNR